MGRQVRRKGIGWRNCWVVVCGLGLPPGAEGMFRLRAEFEHGAKADRGFGGWLSAAIERSLSIPVGAFLASAAHDILLTALDSASPLASRRPWWLRRLLPGAVGSGLAAALHMANTHTATTTK